MGLNIYTRRLLYLLEIPKEDSKKIQVRSLRAIRFSNKLNFKIDNLVKDAIYDKGHLLSGISNARLFDEFCKIFLNGMGEKNFEKLCSFHLNKYLILSDPNRNDFANNVMTHALRNTDDRGKKSTVNYTRLSYGCIVMALFIEEVF
jgi:tRNA nucleotidyltransferase/poly(A) polymerase